MPRHPAMPTVRTGPMLRRRTAPTQDCDVALRADDTGDTVAPRDAPSDPPTRPSRRQPSVLFVDDGPLAPFVQLAVMVRRFGYRTIRITTAPRTLGSALTRRVAFDRVLYVQQAGLAELSRLLVDEQ